MASTNKTTHYDLSQYVSGDKPTYLSDYNGDMAKIDTGINAAKTTADGASTAATNAATAAETAQTTANTAVTNAATAQTAADSANTKIGTLANLTTSEKTNLVGAINEVNTKATNNSNHIGNIGDLTTSSKTDLVVAINSVNSAKKSKGTVLYSNNTGTTGNVTLSETSANYKYIEIVFKQYQGYSSSVEVDIKRDNTASLNVSYIGDGRLWIDNKLVTISGSTITVDGYCNAYIGSTIFGFDSTQNNIKIIEVIGYKD